MTLNMVSAEATWDRLILTLPLLVFFLEQVNYTNLAQVRLLYQVPIHTGGTDITAGGILITNDRNLGAVGALMQIMSLLGMVQHLLQVMQMFPWQLIEVLMYRLEPQNY